MFCEVRAGSYGIDVEGPVAAVEKVPKSGTLTPMAAISVDLFGLPADYPEIREVADRYGLRVLADAAQPYGATRNGTSVGAFADATSTWFFPEKSLGCARDGEAVLADDQELAELLGSIRVHGKGSDKYDTVRIGLNSRLDTLQAAVLLAKLVVFDTELEARKSLAARYSEAFVSLEGVIIPSSEPSAWAQYTVAVDSRNRDELIERLRRSGVSTAIYYPRALHDQPAYVGEHAKLSRSLSVSTRLAKSVLSLPMHPYVSLNEADHVIEALQEAVSAVS